MEIRLIIGQYPQRYPGQYMPNVLDAWDEYTLEDNWEGYEEKLNQYKSWVEKGELEGVREMVIRVPTDTVLALFDPPPVVEADVEVVDE
jgi:hypothetical protein